MKILSSIRPYFPENVTLNIGVDLPIGNPLSQNAAAVWNVTTVSRSVRASPPPPPPPPPTVPHNFFFIKTPRRGNKTKKQFPHVKYLNKKRGGSLKLKTVKKYGGGFPPPPSPPPITFS